MSQISLLDPHFQTTGPHGQATLSLPEILAALGRGDEIELDGLRPHQHHAWHAFLVQLGALVAHRTGDDDLKRSADDWRQGLLELAGDAGEDAWSLVVEDLDRPAFLQPPVPEGNLTRFRNEARQADALDVVITTRNHDVKEGRMERSRPEHWVYTLVTLQTMEGFLGRGNYGIARMNGGFASRPYVASAPGLGWAGAFRRDVGVWLQERDKLVDDYGYPDAGGSALLWLLPWDGKASRGLSQCDPFFIEVCRRVRMVSADSGLVARFAPSEASFLDAKERRGNTGDIWTPVKVDNEGPVALTVSGSGFSYRLLADLLLGESEYRRKPALLFRPDDGDEPLVIVRVLARGQGKTDGYHERVLPVPAPVRVKLGIPAQAASLGERAQWRIKTAREAQRRVLKPALCALFQGSSRDLDFRDPRPQPWIDRLDRDIDQTFFPDLWASLDLDETEAQDAWNQRLRDLAQAQLDDAVDAGPVRLSDRPRCLAQAQLLFWGTARKNLPLSRDADATPSPTEETDDRDQP